MRKLLYVGAAVAALAISSSSGNAMSINIGAGLKPALDATDATQKVAVFIVEGYRYCFYFDGWHGPGWYRCGYARRQNLGWGGEYGWQSWSYGPAERRFGHGARDRGPVEERPGRHNEGGTTIRRGPPVAEPRGGAEIHSGGQMQKNAAPVGGGQMQRNAAPVGGGQMQKNSAPVGGGQMQRNSAPGGGSPGGGEGRGQGGGEGGGQGGGQGGGGPGGGGEKR
jgi:hypothetical protein